MGLGMDAAEAIPSSHLLCCSADKLVKSTIVKRLRNFQIFNVEKVIC